MFTLVSASLYMSNANLKILWDSIATFSVEVRFYGENNVLSCLISNIFVANPGLFSLNVIQGK